MTSAPLEYCCEELLTDDVGAGALHRLQDDSGDPVALSVQKTLEVARAVVIDMADHAGIDAVHLLPQVLSREGHGAQGGAVVGAFEGYDHAAVRLAAQYLDLTDDFHRGVEGRGPGCGVDCAPIAPRAGCLQ